MQKLESYKDTINSIEQRCDFYPPLLAWRVMHRFTDSTGEKWLYPERPILFGQEPCKECLKGLFDMAVAAAVRKEEEIRAARTTN